MSWPQGWNFYKLNANTSHRARLNLLDKSGCLDALWKLEDMTVVIPGPDNRYSMEHLTTDRVITNQLGHEAQPGAGDANQVKRK
jgi:hypothetical protein